MRKAWKSNRSGDLEHSRAPRATGHPKSERCKQEVEVETKGWPPSLNPALFILWSPASPDLSSQHGEIGHILGHLPPTTDLEHTR